MIRIAFLINFKAKSWIGGYNFIINLIDSLRFLNSKKIQPVLIVGKKFNTKNLKNNNLEIIKTNLFNENLPKRIFNKFLIFLFGKSYIYEKFFKKKRIDVFSHSQIPLGKKSNIKSFPWITDFQYLHYPENFSLKNRILKSINVKFLGIHSNQIILSSKNAKKDLKKISLNAHNKSTVNSFVFNLISQKKIININALMKKYKLSEKFFYLPNQYFVHKNHIVVLKALNHILKTKKFKKFEIVSTGHNVDHRDLGHFKKIKNYIYKNNLKKNYIYLGVIPYNDMMSLMYHSIAVLNPSKFEGWSSSVEQAKSMGKKVILSNIQVHKEQNPERAKYFNANNSLELSKILIKEWLVFNKNLEKRKTKASYLKLKKRLSIFANNYIKIINA